MRRKELYVVSKKIDYEIAKQIAKNRYDDCYCANSVGFMFEREFDYPIHRKRFRHYWVFIGERL